MNNTFNINRFGLLLKRQWLDFGKIYLISLVVLLGIVVGLYSYSIPSPLKSNNFDYDGDLDMRFRYGLFLMLGFIFISVVASSYFALLGQKSRAILELMTPASVFEKFLAGVVYTAIISLFSYLLIFYLTDLAFVKYLNGHLDAFKGLSPNNAIVKPVEAINYQVFNDEGYRKYCSYFFAFPFLITSVFLLGSVYFNRFHYIKTALSVMVFTGLASYLVVKLSMWLMEGKVANHHNFRKEDRDWILLIVLLVTSIITLIIWTITYIRLKEKEV
ncbi:hypothetical protein IM793_15390 [Pedobacter sp. MR2016-19]|uniref:hypothetical protein n=1 Tax=Pedobacter sp. MR2016-19 TaxID=2780089 RepID=UPI001047F615|nr:hypothetical protein [Pedobacter sp. MR2016-19]MBE5320550.1 hypothetical protein [Pedobacter sp. MR2016-19]